MALEQENKNKDKSIRISDEVIASIATISLKDVAGVAGIANSGKMSLMKSVKSEMKDGEILIDVAVTVEYGVNIPEVAWEIQRKLKKSVESMTGLTVQRVNVLVKDIQVETPETTETSTEEKAE